MIEITGFAKSNGILSKRISLNDDGSVRSDGTACLMINGLARRVHLTGMDELSQLVDSLSSNEAIALGALRADLPEQVEIVTKKQLSGLNGAAHPGLIARSSGNIVYRPAKAAVVLFDYDEKGMPPQMRTRIETLGGFGRAMLTVLPEIATSARMMRASTSAGLNRLDTGEKLASSGGLHLYVLIQDGQDVDRCLRTAHDRCWLSGFGWMMVGAAGQLLERSIVDRMVGAPERLVFEGAPVLIPPLAQDAASRQPQVRDGEPLDTVAACPPLTILEQSRLRGLRAQEAQRLAPASATARAAFVAKQSKKIVERTGILPKAAMRIVERQCDGVLLPDVLLLFDDPALANITVADVLADPERFEGSTLADPLEGVEYGTCKAKVLRRADGTPWIHSFAHGRTVYELRYDATAIGATLANAPKDEVAALFVKLALCADLTDGETEALRNAVAQRAGIGRRTLATTLKKAQQERLKQRHHEEQERRAAERRDPRPQIAAPASDAPWLPQMRLLNDVLGSSCDPEPPMRDVDGFVTRVRLRRVQGLHELTADGANETETEESRLPAPELPLLTRLDDAQLAELIEQHIDYTDDADRSVHLAAPFVRHFVCRHDTALPLVAAVTTLPIVLPNGTILSGRGLDRKRGIVFRVSNELQATLPGPESCTPVAVAQAMRFLCDVWMLDVATGYDGKCVLVGLALSVLERLLLPERPAFFVTAGQRGGGKTTIINMLSTAVLGRRAAACAWSSSEEERRKSLFSYLLEGVPLLVWDNIPRATAIACPSLERALTAESYCDRVLGETGIRTASAATVMAFTGNNVGPKGDMASRSLAARLTVDRVDPENREFTHENPIAWTEAHRGRILGALYTVLIGNPRLRAADPSAAETRFKAWWHLVGAAVENAAEQHVATMTDDERPTCPPALVSFCDMFLDGEADDEQSDSLGTVLLVLRTKWPGGFTAFQVASYAGAAAEDAVEFRASLEQASGGLPLKVVTARTLSWRLKAIVDAPVSVGKEVLVLRCQSNHENNSFLVKSV